MRTARTRADLLTAASNQPSDDENGR